jgi:predicted secreted Zn-dependent protease
MRFTHAIALLSLTFLTACTTSTVTTGYFQVSGKNEKQLDRSFALNAPMNGHAFAATELQIVPVDFEPTVDARGCYFRSATFKVVAHISYPQWKDRKGAAKDLQRGFDAFSSYARVHEQMHVKIGEEAAKAMQQAVEAVPPQRDCDQLFVKVKAAVKKVYAKHDKAQRAFDAFEKKRIRKLIANAAKG